MGAGPSAPAIVNVGLPGEESDTTAWQDEDGKTHIGYSEHGGFLGLSSVSRILQPSSTRLIVGPTGGVGQNPDGPDGW